MTIRSEKVDTRAVLNGEMGDANFTNPKVRYEERKRILSYWPDDLIVPVRDGFLRAPPWRLLLDPTAWGDVDPREVHDYVRERIVTLGQWPRLDPLRRRFGRVSNHRSGGEVPGQEALL